MNSDVASGRLLFVLLLLLFGLPSEAAADVFDNAQLYRDNGQSILELNFGCSFRFMAYRLLGTGSELEIELAPIGECAQLSEAGSVFELRRPAGSSLAGVDRIEMALRNEQYFLTVRLNVPRDVEISQPSGLRRLRINLGSPAVELVRDDPQGTAYAINLFTAGNPDSLIGAELQLVSKLLYTAQTKVGETIWHHLRLGFYGTESRAEAALEKVRNNYPDAEVVRVSATEFATAARNRVVLQKAGAPVATTRLGQAATGLSAARLQELLAEARAKMRSGDYEAAIEIYARILREGATEASAEALEYLGLAYERNNQPELALAEYRRYLELYPDTPGAERVRQRLEALLLVSGSGGPKGRPAGRRAERSARSNKPEWEIYGGFAQYYRRDVSDFGGSGSEVNQSAVLTDLDIVTRRDGARFDIATRATLGNYYDLLTSDKGPGNDTRIYYLYADVADDKYDVSARFGRQTLRGSGVLGRFDGLHVGWRFNPDWRINFMAGEPVYSTSDDGDSDRSFYGISLDIADLRDSFDVTLYFNAQDVDGIENRQAVGGEFRYFDDRRSLVSTVDYDIGYGSLNNVTVLGNWNFDNQLTLNANFDYRRSPYLLSENALVGQAVDSIDELLLSYTEDEIRMLAEDRSADLTTLSVGFSRPLTENFDLTMDLTAADFGGTAASGGVPAQPGLGTDYYYNVSLIGSGLYKERDAAIFSLRYLDANTVSTSMLSADYRYPLTEKLRVNPRLTIAYRDAAIADSTETLLTPSVRLFWQWRRNLRLELDLGTRLSSQDTAGGSDSSTAWFVYGGYRYNF